MLFQTLKNDRMVAMKEHSEIMKNVLSVIIADAQTKAVNDPKNPHKEPTDEEMLKTIEKYIAANEETISKVEDKSKVELFVQENEILKQYLPKKLTSEELASEISNFVSVNPANKNIGAIMKFLKENFAGKYDGQEASRLAKERI